MVETGVNPDEDINFNGEKRIKQEDVKEVCEASVEPIQRPETKTEGTQTMQQKNKSPRAIRTDPDWKGSQIYKQMKVIYELPQFMKGRRRELLNNFINPDGLDIYNEDEAKQEASTLRK